MNDHGELADGLLGTVLPKAPLWGHATVGDGVHNLEGMFHYHLMVKGCFQGFTETIPATSNFRNGIFPAYPRNGGHFRYEQVIFQKILIWPKVRST